MSRMPATGSRTSSSVITGSAGAGPNPSALGPVAALRPVAALGPVPAVAVHPVTTVPLLPTAATLTALRAIASTAVAVAPAGAGVTIGRRGGVPGLGAGDLCGGRRGAAGA